MAANSTPLKRRRPNWLIIALALSPLILFFVATRSFVLSPIISVFLSNAIGADVEVGSSTVGLSGNLSLHNVVLKANGVDGLASNVLTLQEVKVQFDSSIPIGGANIEKVEVSSALIRIAESSETTGEFNFSHLFPEPIVGDEEQPDETTIGRLSLLPEFSLEEIVIESGVMSKGKWTLDNRKEFSVTFVPNKKGNLAYKIKDKEDSNASELFLEFSETQFHLKVDKLSFVHPIFDLLPRTVRVWQNETNLEGGLDSLEVDWSEGEGVVAKAVINKIQFSLPQEHGLPWTHYESGKFEKIQGNATLYVERGTIEYDGNSLVLKSIEGDLIPPHQESPVAFRSSLKIYDLPNIGTSGDSAWMESMLSTAPFEATFFLEDFQPSEQGEADLPLAASRILTLFQLEKWKIETKASVKRESLGEEIQVGGELFITGASGVYRGFPYPLHEISANIKFNNDDITIEYLSALGSNGAAVHINGTVQAAGDSLVVRIDINAPEAPLDKELHDALPESIATVMDKMLDESALAKMSAVLDASELEDFSLGGTVELNLEVFHDSKVDDSVEVTGEIAFENVGVVHEAFSYPVTLKYGRVLLEESGIYIPDGEMIRFEGSGGGEGKMIGSILFEENGFASPKLGFVLEQEAVNPALIEAVSFAAGESYQLALNVLNGLGLESMLTVKGSVNGNRDEDIDTMFVVEFLDGKAVLQPSLAEAIHATGPFWPKDFTFTKVNAALEINNGAVEITNATCEFVVTKEEKGSVEATMTIDKGEFKLALLGTKLPISNRFVNVLPTSLSGSLSNAWSMFNPGGVMDAEINISKIDGEDTLFLDVQPAALTISGDNKTVALNLVNGSIVVENTNVFLNDLQFELQREGQQQGALGLGGTIRGNIEDFTYDIDANWSNAEIASPLTRAITGIVGGEAGVVHYDSLEPSGTASATLTAHSNETSTGYTVEISPTNLTATLNDHLAVAVFDVYKEGENIIRFTESGIMFDKLDGSLGAGKFTIDTSIDSDRTIDLTWEGPSDDESLFAVLPRVVGETLSAIKMEGGKSELKNGEFTLLGEKWNELDIKFVGDIELHEVSIDVGVPLKEIEGIVNVDAIYNNDELSELTLELRVNEMSVLGRPVTNVSGKMVKDKARKRLVFEELGGESTTGGVALNGWIAIDESKNFELEVLVAGASIGAKDGEDALASLQGELTGWLSVAGKRGDAGDRRGSGVIQVRDGHLEIDSVGMRAMQLMHLSAPTAQAITGADISLYIDGDKIVIDNITLTGDGSSYSDLVLKGEGTVDIDTFTLHARLHPRVGLPILRDITGAFNDQLYSIDVTGELFNPSVSLVPLPFLSPQENE